MPKDYRMISGKEGAFSNKTMLAIRRARRLQRISKELSENIDAELQPKVNPAKLSDNSKDVAENYTSLFNITNEIRNNWKTPYEAFSFLRNLIEDRNIIVFKMSMPVEDARGFTLSDDTPNIIVVNSRDLPEAQVFTLLHEFGHVILNKSGVSIPDNALFNRQADPVEMWCNEFSSAILLPKTFAIDKFNRNKGNLTETRTLNFLSKKLKISKAMLLYNMLKLGYINQSDYNGVIGRYNPTIPPPKKENKIKGKSGGVSADKKCISEKGQMFVSLVAKNMDKGFITRNEALDYLAIKSKNLENVTKKAKR